MRLAFALVTLTLSLAASAQTAANPLAGLLVARQTDSADQDACIGACEQQLASQKGSAVQKCAEKANGDITSLQKCFCQTGIYDASAGCIQKCFPDGSGDEAEAAIKQQCAGLGVNTGSGGNGASTGVRASGALAIVVGVVAVAVI